MMPSGLLLPKRDPRGNRSASTGMHFYFAKAR